MGFTWCCWKACEICSLLVQKKKLKKNVLSSLRLPKQQMIKLWSQGILKIKCQTLC
jgi:hypothetical protein